MARQRTSGSKRMLRVLLLFYAAMVVLPILTCFFAYYQSLHFAIAREMEIQSSMAGIGMERLESSLQDADAYAASLMRLQCFEQYLRMTGTQKNKLTAQMRELCKETGGSIEQTDSLDGLEGADAVYTDVWVSMGEEAQFAERIRLLEPYRVTMDALRRTGNPDVLFLHCLPAFHDLNTVVGRDIFERFGLTCMEVTDEVFRSRHSVVFDEAENRMHTIKAVMVATLAESL